MTALSLPLFASAVFPHIPAPFSFISMNDRRSVMLQNSGLARTITMAAVSGAMGANRESKRMSVNHFYSMAAEQDVDVQDDLSHAQRELRDLKANISAQSKRNFVLERDVRYLDGRIALLIQNKMNQLEV